MSGGPLTPARHMMVFLGCALLLTAIATAFSATSSHPARPVSHPGKVAAGRWERAERHTLIQFTRGYIRWLNGSRRLPPATLTLLARELASQPSFRRAQTGRRQHLLGLTIPAEDDGRVWLRIGDGEGVQYTLLATLTFTHGQFAVSHLEATP